MTRRVGIEIFYWLDNWSDDQSSVFARPPRPGYDGVEISLVAGLDVGVERMERTAASLGLDVLCSTGLSPTMDISSPDPAIRSAGADHLRRSLDQGRAVAQPHPRRGGPLPLGWVSHEGDHDSYRRRSAEALHDVAGYAATLGVDICLEVLNPVRDLHVQHRADCLRFIDMVDHPSVKVELDTFHMNMEEDDLAGAVRLASGRIGHVQVAANNRRAPQYGHIDWHPFREALDEAGYDGWVVFEDLPQLEGRDRPGNVRVAGPDRRPRPGRDRRGAVHQGEHRMNVRTRRFLNRPEEAVQEMLEGYAAAHSDIIRLSGGLVVRATSKREGRVGVVIGNGSGHEPAMIGWVGEGLFDVNVPGPIFSSPGPGAISKASGQPTGEEACCSSCPATQAT